jgi:hypothetical protein
LTSTRTIPGKRRPLVAGITIIVLLALIGWLYASPYLVLKQLKQAVDSHDAQAISEHVDFPALRENLKLQLTSEMTHQLGAAQRDNPLAVLGLMIGSAVVSPLVDAYASPSGVAAIMNGIPPVLLPGPGQQPPPLAPANAMPSDSGNSPASDSSAAPPQAASVPAAQAHAGYRGLNQFVVTFPRGTNGSTYSAIFQRSGLFGWKLAGLDLNQ